MGGDFGGEVAVMGVGSAVQQEGRRERLGQSLMSVKDVARFLRVSEKTVRRMEAAGKLRRCVGLDYLVRFRPSDVLRLASAK